MAIKIVIAEDEEHIGKMISFKLTKEGYQVHWVQNGIDALEAIRSEKPDLILLDVMMPDLDGFAVLDEIKQDETLAQLPVVMLTAKGQESDIVGGIDKGAADYIVKPFRSAELVARIKRLLPRS